MVGELSLEGRTRPAKGALSMAIAAARSGGLRGIVVPDSKVQACFRAGPWWDARTVRCVVSYGLTTSNGRAGSGPIKLRTSRVLPSFSVTVV